jgi:hypothetical protein
MNLCFPVNVLSLIILPPFHLLTNSFIHFGVRKGSASQEIFSLPRTFQVVRLPVFIQLRLFVDVAVLGHNAMWTCNPEDGSTIFHVTLVSIFKTTRRQNPQIWHRQLHRRENRKPQTPRLAIYAIFSSNTGCSKSNDAHGEMQYKFYFFIIMPISYNKFWKCPPLRSSQRCTRRVMLANTFCNVPVDILSTVRWMLAWSSCTVCVDDLNIQYPRDAPIKRSLGGGLKSGDRGGHNLFEMRRPGNTDSK